MNKQYPTPLLDYYILLPDEGDVGNDYGAIMPDEYKDKPSSGVVKAVGKGLQAIETGVWIEQQAAEGDRVLFRRFKDAPILIGDKQHLIVSQNDLLLIL